MTRGIYTKWIIGAACLLLIVFCGCYWYYQHTTAQNNAEADKVDKLLKQWKAEKEKSTITAETELTQAPAESNTLNAEKPSNETMNVPDNVPGNADTSHAKALDAPGETSEDVPVSPYGFGSYPKLPEGWSPKTWPARSAESELTKRVLIKLWHQGDIRTKSGAMKDGLVYPIVPGTLYVEWDTYNGPFESVRYICRSTGHPADFPRLEAISLAKRERRAHPRSLTREDIPSDIKLVPYSEGINPYTFLDLP